MRLLESITGAMELSRRSVTAVDRFKGAQGGFEGFSLPPWVLVLLAVVLVMLVAVAVAIILNKRKSTPKAAKQSRRALWDLFNEQVVRRGLSPEQKNILLQIAQLANLSHPEEVFTINAAFEYGAAALTKSAKFASLPASTQETLTDMIDGIRQKLGFQRIGGPKKDDSNLLKDLTIGGQLSILQRATASGFDATVAAATSEELSVQLARAMPCKAGDNWLVRMYKEDRVIELDASVVRRQDDKVSLKPAGKPRVINRRRFPRVATFKDAFVARFSFRVNPADGDTPKFVPAKLVEIAGVGLQLESQLTAEMNERLLVVLRFSNEVTVQAMGRCCRMFINENNDAVLAVELMGLGDEDMQELVTQTNIAAAQMRSVADGSAEAEAKREPASSENAADQNDQLAPGEAAQAAEQTERIGAT